MAFDAGAYVTQRQNIRSDYAAQRAANEYARRLSQQRGNRQIGDLRTAYNRAIPGFVSGYTGRGLAGEGVQSGVYRNALSNYAADQFRRVQDVQDQMRSDWNGFDQQNRMLAQQKQSALAELEWKRRMEIMAAAAQLAQMR